jgi:hypothetical protein
MGIFTYSRLISSAIMRKNIHSHYLLILPPPMPTLTSTPSSFRASGFSQIMDELTSIEDKFKEILTTIITNQERITPKT